MTALDLINLEHFQQEEKRMDEQRKNKNLGSFTVDVEVMPDGSLDVWIAHEGSSGEHYIGVSEDEVGEYVAELIECVKEEAEAC